MSHAHTILSYANPVWQFSMSCVLLASHMISYKFLNEDSSEAEKVGHKYAYYAKSELYSWVC